MRGVHACVYMGRTCQIGAQAAAVCQARWCCARSRRARSGLCSCRGRPPPQVPWARLREASALHISGGWRASQPPALWHRAKRGGLRERWTSWPPSVGQSDPLGRNIWAPPRHGLWPTDVSERGSAGTPETGVHPSGRCTCRYRACPVSSAVAGRPAGRCRLSPAAVPVPRAALAWPRSNKRGLPCPSSPAAAEPLSTAGIPFSSPERIDFQGLSAPEHDGARPGQNPWIGVSCG